MIVSVALMPTPTTSMVFFDPGFNSAALMMKTLYPSVRDFQAQPVRNPHFPSLDRGWTPGDTGRGGV
jgi:hypothetical protein